jgi:rod shape-determining protein MreC
MMSKNKVIIIAVFIIISFFIFRHCARAGVSILETVSSSILYPLLRVQNATLVPIAQWFDDRKTMHELRSNIAHLEKLNEELYAENSALKSLHLYESETRELRNFNKRYALEKGHLVQVLARHFSPTQQFFLVDAGSSQGIKKDMVALYGNTIVGRVDQVHPWYCKVCLITDADCKVAATCLSEKNLIKKGLSAIALAKAGASGIHEGINDVKCTKVKYVSHLESVNVHDTVLSSGEGLVFPKGFALGKIETAEKGELFYEITVRLLLDLQNLHYCTLIAKEDIG